MKRLLASVTTALASVVFAATAFADDAPLCASPVQLQGFKSCADIAKAEQEGEVVLYTTDPERGTAQLLDAFNKMFPKINTKYLRLQAGALYAKVLSERQARSYTVDALQLSDIGFVLDFQKKGGYLHYVSPEMAAYKPEYKSQPEGFWIWGAVIMSGLAYNPNVTSADQAPKTWEDALDAKWADQVSVKVANSGLQHVTWYELRRVLGPDYFKKLAALKPRAFDSYVQQYDRVTNRQDKLIHTAQYSGYLEFKAKGAPIEFVYPAAGLPAGPETYGLVSNAPHPNAAHLFMDWLLSVPGQTALSAALFLNSPRSDVPAPGGGVRASDLKLLFPSDWQAFVDSRPEFVREWDKLTGMR
jgi:iron(III) transport system substrate-binding protein